MRSRVDIKVKNFNWTLLNPVNRENWVDIYDANPPKTQTAVCITTHAHRKMDEIGDISVGQTQYLRKMYIHWCVRQPG